MKIKKVTIWVLSILLSLVFLIAGSGKFDLEGTMYQNFIRWGYSGSLMVLVGIMEGVGALLLIIPKTRLYGTSILAIVMIGATFTHFSHFEELGFPFLSLALILILVLIAFLHKKTSTND